MNTGFYLKSLVRFTGLAVLWLAGVAGAQEQQTGLCAPVQIQILQKLTLERVGFLATLTIADNSGNNPITGFAANLTFENPQLSTNGVNDSSSLFFVQPPTFQNISDVNGSGVIQPGQTAPGFHFNLLWYTFFRPGKWLKLVNLTGGKSSAKTQLTYHGTINCG